MLVKSLRFIHLQLPFKGAFTHARKSRAFSDTLLVEVKDEQERCGWGEILARPYVTGESHSQIMQHDCVKLSAQVLGLKFASEGELLTWVEQQLPKQEQHLALFGGVELALWNLLAQSSELDLQQLIGARRQNTPGHCTTIGYDAERKDLRSRVLLANLQGSTVIKLKVGQDNQTDIERVTHIGELIAGGQKRSLRLRLDGNACLTLDTALSLLNHCKQSGIPVESFEEPLQLDDTDLPSQLRELHQRTGVALLADESVCSLADALACIRNKSFQSFNIRLGKHGGLVASRQVRDCARAAGIGIVGGSMVGESGILTQAAELFLAHSDDLEYIEGLGQNRSWLTHDPVKPIQSAVTQFKPFEYLEAQTQQFVKSERLFS